MRKAMGFAVLLILLIAAGWFVGNATASTSAEPEGESPPEPPQVVTEEVTPEACLEALDNAEAVFGTSAQGFHHVAEILDAIEQDDASALDSATNGLVKAQLRVDQDIDTYQDSAIECRGAK